MLEPTFAIVRPRAAFERDFAGVYRDSLPLLQRCLASPDVAAARDASARRSAERARSEGSSGH